MCSGLKNELKCAVEKCVHVLSKGGWIFTCGNGGSSSDSSHLSAELLKSFMLKRKLSKNDLPQLDDIAEDADSIRLNLQKGLKCIPLTSFSSYESAFCNDCNGEFVYANLVYSLASKGDLLILFSTSGNSKNIIRAAQVAKSMGVFVLLFSGRSGGKLKHLSDISLLAPSDIVYEIQEYHLPLYHILCLCIESEMFDE